MDLLVQTKDTEMRTHGATWKIGKRERRTRASWTRSSWSVSPERILFHTAHTRTFSEVGEPDWLWVDTSSNSLMAIAFFGVNAFSEVISPL